MEGSELKRQGIKVEILDGNVIRDNLIKSPGFLNEDRSMNIRLEIMLLDVGALA